MDSPSNPEAIATCFGMVSMLTGSMMPRVCSEAFDQKRIRDRPEIGKI